jgi:hypothetical protein
MLHVLSVFAVLLDWATLLGRACLELPARFVGIASSTQIESSTVQLHHQMARRDLLAKAKFEPRLPLDCRMMLCALIIPVRVGVGIGACLNSPRASKIYQACTISTPLNPTNRAVMN